MTTAVMLSMFKTNKCCKETDNTHFFHLRHKFPAKWNTRASRLRSREREDLFANDSYSSYSYHKYHLYIAMHHLIFSIFYSISRLVIYPRSLQLPFHPSINSGSTFTEIPVHSSIFGKSQCAPVGLLTTVCQLFYVSDLFFKKPVTDWPDTCLHLDLFTKQLFSRWPAMSKFIPPKSCHYRRQRRPPNHIRKNVLTAQADYF